MLRTKKSKMMVAAAKTIMQPKMTRLTPISIPAVSTISIGYTSERSARRTPTTPMPAISHRDIPPPSMNSPSAIRIPARIRITMALKITMNPIA